MPKKKVIPDVTDTSMAARLARLETHLLQKEEERLRAEETKAKKREESSRRSKEQEKARVKRRVEAAALIKAELEKLCPDGWSLLDDDLRVYGYGGDEASAWRMAIRKHGETFEVKVVPGFEDEDSYACEGPPTLTRSLDIWAVFGRPHSNGRSYVQCAECNGSGVHLIESAESRKVATTN